MTISLADFLEQVLASPMMAVTVALTLGVILVNGWTDAPNAIATCVSTRSMGAGSAILMAAAFNFLGVLVMTMVNARVAMTVYGMVDLGGNAHHGAVALCAALFAIVIWATAAWFFGVPTSESHALIAGLSGAAVALRSGLAGVNLAQWRKVLYGLLLSTALGFGAGFGAARITERLCRNRDRRSTAGFFRWAQIAGGAGTAFMHGAQDGQKFMGVFLLGISLINGQNASEFTVPLWLMVLCSAVMALGTGLGGYRIIKAVGMDMVKLRPYQGFASDLGATACLLFSSLTGVPISTTHTKTAAIMGVGASRRLSAVNWRIVGQMALGWALTFPGCGLMGFAMAKLFMRIF